jgi:hypothetical protein
MVPNSLYFKINFFKIIKKIPVVVNKTQIILILILSSLLKLFKLLLKYNKIYNNSIIVSDFIN